MKALVILLFLAVVTAFTLSSKSCCDCHQDIAEELADDTLKVLEGNPLLSEVKASYKYLDVVLDGEVPEGLKEITGQQVEEGLRAGRVINRLVEVPVVVQVPTEPTTIGFEKNGARMILSGMVATEEIKESIGLAARQTEGIENVINRLEVSPTVHPFPNAGQTAVVAGALFEKTGRGTIHLSDQALRLEGTVPTEATRTALGQQAGTLVTSRQVSNALEVVQVSNPISIDCFVQRENGRNEGLLRGTVPSQNYRVAVVEAARAGAPELEWTDEMNVSSQTATPQWEKKFPGFMTRHLKENPNSGFLVRDHSIRFLNMPEPDKRAQTTFGTRQELDSEMDVSFEGELVAEKPANRSVNLTVTGPQDYLIFKGAMPNATLKEGVMKRAKQARPDATLFDYMKVREEVSSPEWENEVPAFVGDYLKRGGLTGFEIENEKLILKGEVADA
ncbi:MAG: BON domain-containing protein, partial [Verrucomicrobiota bacterium]